MLKDSVAQVGPRLKRLMSYYSNALGKEHNSFIGRSKNLLNHMKCDFIATTQI